VTQYRILLVQIVLFSLSTSLETGVDFLTGYCGENVSQILEVAGTVGGEMISGDERVPFSSHQKIMCLMNFQIIFENTEVYNNDTRCNYTLNITSEIGYENHHLVISIGEDYTVSTYRIAAPPLSLESSPDGDLLILTNVSASWYESNVTLFCPDCQNKDLVTLQMNTTTGNFVIPIPKVFSSTSDELILVDVTVANTCGETWNGSTSESTTMRPRDSGHAPSVTPRLSECMREFR
jgi:hypothetical protein